MVIIIQPMPELFHDNIVFFWCASLECLGHNYWDHNNLEGRQKVPCCTSKRSSSASQSPDTLNSQSRNILISQSDDDAHEYLWQKGFPVRTRPPKTEICPHLTDLILCWIQLCMWHPVFYSDIYRAFISSNNITAKLATTLIYHNLWIKRIYVKTDSSVFLGEWVYAIIN